MAAKRIFLNDKDDKEIAKLRILYYCPYCGTEVVGNTNDFLKRDVTNKDFYYFKEDAKCPACNNKIEYKDGYYLDLSYHTLIVLSGNLGTPATELLMAMGGYNYYYNPEDYSVQVLHNSRDKEQIQAQKLVRLWEMDAAFEFLRKVRWREKENTINNNINILISDSESLPVEVLIYNEN